MTKDIFDVQEKIIIITGGLGQLGTQFTLALTERGAKVASFDLQSDEKEIAPTLRSWVGRDHLHRHQVEAFPFETVQNLADNLCGHAVGLDQKTGAFSQFGPFPPLEGVYSTKLRPEMPGGELQSSVSV